MSVGLSRFSQAALSGAMDPPLGPLPVHPASMLLKFCSDIGLEVHLANLEEFRPTWVIFTCVVTFFSYCGLRSHSCGFHSSPNAKSCDHDQSCHWSTVDLAKFHVSMTTILKQKAEKNGNPTSMHSWSRVGHFFSIFFLYHSRQLKRPVNDGSHLSVTASITFFSHVYCSFWINNVMSSGLQ